MKSKQPKQTSHSLFVDIFKINRFDFLVAVYVFCIVTAELMGMKTFYIGTIFGFPLNASVAIFVIPALFTINDMIVEVHGIERAKSVIRSSLLIIIMLFFFILLATSLPPSTRFEPYEEMYDTLFSKSLRISFASIVAFAVADFLDVIIFQKIRQKLFKFGLWFRNNASNFISQFIDSTIFMFIAFYAFDRGFDANVGFLFSLIIPYWLLKCSMSVLGTPLVYLGVKWLKKDLV